MTGTAITRAIALRAYVPPSRPHRRRAPLGDPALVLVFDTETTIDRAQRLLFGSYRLHRADGALLQEGLFHPDDAPAEDMAMLRRYCETHADDGGGQLRLLTRTQFVDWLIWKIGYLARALIVGFNLPFDFSRIALGWRPSRNGGFSLNLWESIDSDGRRRRHLWRPELTIKSLDSRRHFVSFTTPAYLDDANRVGKHGYRGRFADLRTLSYALSDRSHSLASAAEAWDLPTGKFDLDRFGEVSESAIDYNRQDTRLTYELYRALAEDWSLHPVDLDPEQAFSPAGVSKAYLRRMGITPPLGRLR